MNLKVVVVLSGRKLGFIESMLVWGYFYVEFVLFLHHTSVCVTFFGASISDMSVYVMCMQKFILWHIAYYYIQYI